MTRKFSLLSGAIENPAVVKRAMDPPDNSMIIRVTPTTQIRYRRIAFENSLLFPIMVSKVKELIDKHDKGILRVNRNIEFRREFHEGEVFFKDRSTLDMFEQELDEIESYKL